MGFVGGFSMRCRFRGGSWFGGGLGGGVGGRRVGRWVKIVDLVFLSRVFVVGLSLGLEEK